MTSSSLRNLWVALFAGVAMTSGIGCTSHSPGTLIGSPIDITPVIRRPQVTIQVSPVLDIRPAVEHEGDTVGTKLFIFFLAGWHSAREGNFVTSDFLAAPDAPRELRTLMGAHLMAKRAVRGVVESGADFEIKIRVEHLYGTHYAANHHTVIISKDSRSAFVDARSKNFGAYGNVVLHAELWDRRGGKSEMVWTEHVLGSAQRPPGGDRIAEIQEAVRLAAADALGTLSERIGSALDRMGLGPSGPPMVLADGGPMPPTFAIARMSRYRDFLERVYIETSTGRAIRHEVIPAPDRYASRPGDWVLARVTSEAAALSPEGYLAFAKALSRKYDLRRVDDATHFHFFGLKGKAP